MLYLSSPALHGGDCSVWTRVRFIKYNSHEICIFLFRAIIPLTETRHGWMSPRKMAM